MTARAPFASSAGHYESAPRRARSMEKMTMKKMGSLGSVGSTVGHAPPKRRHGIGGPTMALLEVLNRSPLPVLGSTTNE